MWYSVLLEDYAFSLAFSVSYICLFIVLTVYKYEVMFRTGVLIVAAIGPFFQILYALPYIFIVWRVFVGLNVATDQKLFIGRHIHVGHSNETIEQNDMDKGDFSGSTTLNHWVVVIQDGARYIYTHAVGEVVSGKGIKKPFKPIPGDQLHKTYRLNHIGFVTREERDRKLTEVVEFEPMVSGNSCQEYAVDIAFQLSSSRTYTFVKTMTLPRFRNTVFYIALILSISLMVLGYSYAYLLNPLVLTNLFAAWELSRIGIHNQAQGAYFPVIRAYITYPTKGNFLVLLLIFVSVVYLSKRLGIEECIVIVSVSLLITLVLLR